MTSEDTLKSQVVARVIALSMVVFATADAFIHLGKALSGRVIHLKQALFCMGAALVLPIAGFFVPRIFTYFKEKEIVKEKEVEVVEAVDVEEPLPFEKEVALRKEAKKAYIEAHSWLKKEGLPVDFPFLSALNGGAFALEFPLDGCPLSGAISNFVNLYKEVGGEFKGEKTQAFFKELEECQGIVKKLEKGKAVAKELKQELDQKGSLLMPGGLGMFYKIEKNKIHIFHNGKDNFQELFAGEKEGRYRDEVRSAQFITIEGEVNELVLATLIDFYLHGTLEGGLHFYKKLEALMKGRILERPDPDKSPDLLKKSQLQSDSHVKGIKRAFYYSVRGENSYKPLKFLFELATLAKFCKTHLKEDLSKKELEFLKDIAANLVRSTKKKGIKEWLKGKEALTDELHATLFDILDQINGFKKSLLVKGEDFKFTYTEDPLPPAPTPARKKETKYIAKYIDTTPEQIAKIDPLFQRIAEGEVFQASRDLLLLLKQEAIRSAYSSNLQKHHTSEKYFQITSDRSPDDSFPFREVLVRYIKDLVLNKRLTSLSQEECLPFMEILYELSLDLPSHSRNDASLFVLSNAVLMMQEILARRLSPELLKGYQVSYLTLHECFSNPFFYVRDQEIQSILKEIFTFAGNGEGKDLLFDCPPYCYHFKYPGTEQIATVKFFEQFTEEKEGAPWLKQMEAILNYSEERSTKKRPFPREIELLRNAAFFPANKTKGVSDSYADCPVICAVTQTPFEMSHLRGRAFESTAAIQLYYLLKECVGESFAQEMKETVFIVSKIQNENDVVIDCDFCKLVEKWKVDPLFLKELLMMGVNPRQAGLQILSYLKNHWFLLENSYVQHLLKVYLFRTFLFHKMSDEEAFFIKEFFKVGMTRFSEMNKRDLYDLLKEVAQDVAPRFPKEDFSFMGPFVSYKLPSAAPEPEIVQKGVFFPLKKRDESLAILDGIDDEFECFGEGGEIKSIVMKKSHLRFAIRNGKAYSEEHAPFFLSTDRLTLLKGIPSLVLENEAGEKKVLFFHELVKEDFAESLGQIASIAAGNFMKGPVAKKSGEKEWLEYSYKNGALTTSLLKNKLFLVHVYLANRDYGEARKLLLSLDPLRRFSKEEQQILAALFLEVNNLHPDGRVLLIQLGLKLWDNELLYPLAVGQKADLQVHLKYAALPLLLWYFFDGSNTTAPLSAEEEKRAFEMLRSLVVHAVGDGAVKTMILTVFDSFFAKRCAYWEKGEIISGITYKGIYKSYYEKFQNLALSKTLDIPLGYIAMDYRKWFICLDHSRDFVLQAKERVRFDTSFIDFELEKHFFDYYAIIKHGSDDDRKRLENLLLYNGIDERAYAELLKDCLKNPKKYPDIKGRHLTEDELWKVLKPFERRTNVGSLVFSLADQTGLLTSLAGYVGTEGVKNYFATRVRKEKAIPPLPNIPEAGWAASLKEWDRREEEKLERLVEKYFTFTEESLSAEGLSIPVPVDAPSFVKKRIEKENAILSGATFDAKRTYQLKKECALLQKELQELIQKRSATLEKMKELILDEAFAFPIEEREKVREVLSQKRLMDFESLIQQKFQPVFRYMVEMTRLNQLKKAEEGVRDYLAEQKEEELQAIPHTLLLKRAYDIEERGALFLPFEMMNGYFCRKEQIEATDKITALQKLHRHLMVRIETGWGKTSYLAPFVNEQKRKEGKLIFNVWPASLVDQNAYDLQNQMEKSFGSSVGRMIFNRQTGFSEESLKYLLEKVKECRQLGKPINVCFATVRAIELHFLMLLETKDERLIPQAKLLKELLDLMESDGFAFVDEFHINGDPFDRLTYTIGGSHKLPEWQVFIVEQFFKILEEFEGELRLEKNGLESFDKKTYPALAEKLAVRCAEKFEKSELVDFLLCKKEMPEWLKQHPQVKQIAFFKGLISLLLKNALDEVAGKSYGVSKLHKLTKGYAIPYFGRGVPKETENAPSQYENPHETLIKTYLYYLAYGLTTLDTTRLIQYLQNQVKKAEMQGTPLELIGAYTAYNDFYDGNPPCPLMHIDALNPPSNLEKNRKAIYYFIKNMIVPQLTIFIESLSSTVQNGLSQFESTLSVTATPPDVVSHSKGAHFEEMGASAAKTTRLFLAKKRDFMVTNSQSAEEIVKEVSRFSGKVCAVIDTGARFKGLSDFRVAQLMKEINPHINGIVYFEGSTFKVLFQNGTVKNFADFKKEKKLAYYFDHIHTYGSDLPLPKDAVARVLLSKDIKADEYKQGVGRLREVHRGQDFEPVTETVVLDEIKKLYKEETIDGSHALGYMLLNDETQKAKVNERSLKEQMDNEIRKVLMHKIKNDFSLYEVFRKELVEVQALDPLSLYGNLGPERPTKTRTVDGRVIKGTLEEYLDACLKRLEGIALGFREKASIRTNLEAYREKCRLETVTLPETSTSADTGKSAYHEEEAQAQNHVEAQQQMQTHSNTGELPKGKRKVWSFNESADLFSAESSFFVPQEKQMFNYYCPIFSLSAVLNDTLRMKKERAFFSEKLLVSNNYYYYKPSLLESVEEPFSIEQKPLFHVLAIKEKGELRMMLIDENDFAYFEKKLKEHPEDSFRTLALYGTDGRFVAGKKVEPDEAFQSLLVQARLFAREIAFDKRELSLIEKRLKETNIKTMHTFMQETVLAHHAPHSTAYEHMPLKGILSRT